MLAAAPRAPKPPANPISDPPQVWRQTVESLGPFLAEVTRFVAEQVDLFDPALLKSAHHALTAAGKQLRPILLGLCLLGIGASFTMPAANAVAMAQVPPDLRGEASGVNMTVRMTGSVIGLLISGSLLAAASRDDVIAGARLSWGIAAAVGLVGLLVGLVALRGAGSASR